MSATTRFGHLGGGLLTATGVLGLAVTGLADPLAPHGEHLTVLEVNSAQNLLHLALGLWMVIGAAATPSTARSAALTATAVLGTLGVVGLALAGPDGNPLALNAWSNGLHLVLALWGVAATLRTDHTTQAMETAPS